MKGWPRATTLAFLVAVATSVRAGNSTPIEDSDQITASLNAFRVEKTPEGKERLIPAQHARVGEIVEYRAEYRNHGKTPVKNLKVEVPVPLGMQYVPGSASPADLAASIDGQHFAPVPQRAAGRAGEKNRRESVPVAQYRLLRWSVAEIAPESAVQLVLRVKLVPRGTDK